MTDLIDEIYQAIGNQPRWERLARRLASGVTAEVAHHVEVARRAHEKYVRLSGEVAALSEVHDQLALGVLLVDGTGQIIRANAVARTVLESPSGLVNDEGGVRALDPDEDAVLRTAIEETSGGGERTTPFVLIQTAGRAPLSVFLVKAPPAVRRFFEHAPAAVLLIFGPERARLAGPLALRALFGFTAREAECADLLMRGRSLAEAARELRVTRATVRTFLKHMAGKTDSHTQSELVARLLAIPSPLAET